MDPVAQIVADFWGIVPGWCNVDRSPSDKSEQKVAELRKRVADLEHLEKLEVQTASQHFLDFDLIGFESQQVN